MKNIMSIKRIMLFLNTSDKAFDISMNENSIKMNLYKKVLFPMT